MTMTEQQRAQYIAALLEERRSYETAGDSDGVAQVDSELSRVGHKAQAPAKRAERRPRATAETRASE